MLAQRSGKFRHVVFADAVNGSPGRAVNFGFPARPDDVNDSPLSEDEHAFCRWLLRQANVDSRHYRDETLGRRLPACLRALHVSSLFQARVLLQHKPELIGSAVSAMLIGVTSFFRDPGVFAYLSKEALPPLVERSGERNGANI